MASAVPKPWWRLLEIRNEGGRKNSEVVFSTSDVEKFSSEVEFSISELFFACRRLVLLGALMDVLMGSVYPSTSLPIYQSTSLPIYQHPMGVPFGGVPLCTTRTVGSPSLRAVSHCGYWEVPPSGTEIVAAFLLWRKTYCCASPLWVMKDDVGEIYLIFNF